MFNGLLIYTPEDYEKNKWFAAQLIEKGTSFGLSLQLVLTNELILGINKQGFFIKSSHKTAPFQDIHFAINRSRDDLIAVHLEQMGILVFNNATVTRICNHKGRTHQLVNGAGIPSVPTILGNRKYFDVSACPFPYPVILKSVSGHGGSEVFMIHTPMALQEKLRLLPNDDFILQQPCTQPGVDVRVFVLGKEIIAAVKRFNPNHFKSNYSLGGHAKPYSLTPHETHIVKEILSLLDFNLAGIDFIFNQNGDFLFNEIEDVVGTRTLYLNYPDIDIVSLYLQHIKSCLA